MSLVFTWAPSKTIDVTRLAYSSFLLVPKGFTSDAHRRYWDFPFRDEQGRVSATLLSRIAKRLAQEGTTEANAIVHRKLEVLVKKANEEAKKLGNPAGEWILKQLPTGNVYLNKRTREERAEVPAERRRLEPAEQPPAPVLPPPRPIVASRVPARVDAPLSSGGAAAKGPAAAARAARPEHVRAAPAKNAQGSPPQPAAALEGRKRLRKALVVASDDEHVPGAAIDVDAAAARGGGDGDGKEEEDEDEEEEEEEESEGEEEEDSSEEVDDEGIQRVLRKCEKLATKMRSALSAFMQTDATPAAPTAGCAESVGLCAIEARGREGVIAQPRTLSSKLVLKPYQLLGLNWLWALHQNELNGILADEMGLGKTVQTIALLAHLKLCAAERGKRAGPFLVVTPTSTAENWAREFAEWCPSLVCEKYVGTESERAQLREQLRCGGRSGCGWDVVITTYSLFERDSSSAKEDRSFLNKQRFDYIVLDEAHCIKNSNSARYRNLCRMSARRRLLLTGTPLENSLRELYTLLAFLMPSLLGPKERDELIGASHGAAALDAARRVMAPFVLRRLKSQVLTQLLLPKEELTVRLQMDATHAAAYDALLTAHAARVEAARAAAAVAAAAAGASASGNAELDDLILAGGGVGAAGAAAPAAPAAPGARAPSTRGGDDDAAARGRIATSLSAERKWAKHAFTELRKAAQHPLLVRSRYDEAALGRIAQVLWRSGHYGDNASHERVAEEVGALSDFKLHELCMQHRVLADLELPPDAIRSSAKLRHLAELLPKLRAEGHRVVIFSQWTSLLDILQALIGPGPGGLDLPFVRFDGSTSADDRQLLIDTFSASDEVFAFLLTTRAGGVGINLTAADTVILHDVDFNPAVDLQAQDRVHRIGQTRPVTIHRLVTAGTVDEKILQLQSRKAEINDRILHGDDAADGRAAQDAEASICGAILNDLLNERLARQSQLRAREDAAPAADVPLAAAPAAAPVEQSACAAMLIAADARAGGVDAPGRPPPPHVLAEASGGRANVGVPASADAAMVDATHTAAAAAVAAGTPSDEQLLAALAPLVPPADSAEFAALTLKPIKRALVDRLGPAAKLSNENLGKLIGTLVERRRTAPGAAVAFETRTNSLTGSA